MLVSTFCVGADNTPYVSENHVAADMKTLFDQTKRLYGKRELLGDCVREAQQTWLSQCSDKIERQPKWSGAELHAAWEFADAHDVRTLSDAQKRLRDAVEDKSAAQPNNATALMHAVRRAVLLFLVRLVKTLIATLTSNQCAYNSATWRSRLQSSCDSKVINDCVKQLFSICHKHLLS